MQTSIPVELIFSHYWGIYSRPRLAVMHRSLETLLSKIGNPKIEVNDTIILKQLINNGARWFSMNISLSALQYAENYGTFDFEDLVFLIALSYNPCVDIEESYVGELVEMYFSRKNNGCHGKASLVSEITRNTYGLLIYREQAASLIVKVTGITDEEANHVVSGLRRRDADAENFGEKFIKSGILNGFDKTEISEIWAFIYLRAQCLLDYDFSLALGWLLYQIEYMNTYYFDMIRREVEIFEQSYDLSIVLNKIKILLSGTSLKSFIEKESKSIDGRKLWEKCIELLKDQLPDRKIQWLKDVSFHSFEDSVLVLNVKNLETVERLETLVDKNKKDRYHNGIFAIILKEVWGEDVKLQYKYSLR